MLFSQMAFPDSFSRLNLRWLRGARSSHARRGRGPGAALAALLWAAPAAALAPNGCEVPLMVMPPRAPAGAVVALTGECQPIHSGASAEVRLDGMRIAAVSGNTGGDFLTLVAIPAQIAVGSHRLQLANLFVGAEEDFAVTAARPCVGDCDGDAAVTIDELISGVRVVGGERELAACPLLDFDGDQQAGIDELIAAVAASLESCTPPAALATFAGRYDAATSAAGDYAPGAVQRGEADVHVTETGALAITFPYGVGTVRLTAVASIAGGLMVDGVVEFASGSATPVTGHAVFVADGDERWISAALDLAGFPAEPPRATYVVLSAAGDAAH